MKYLVVCLVLVWISAMIASARININTALLEELVTLPSIGEVKAQRIIDGRPYGVISDILRVSGIGPATFEKLKRLICVGGGDCENPLPVIFSMKVAEVTDEGILISWRTATEIDSLGFNVYKIEFNPYDGNTEFKLNDKIILAGKKRYLWLDAFGKRTPGKFYVIEEIDIRGIAVRVNVPWAKPARLLIPTTLGNLKEVR